MHKDNSILMITNTAGIKRYSTCQAAIKIFLNFLHIESKFFPRKSPLDLFFQNKIYHIGAGHFQRGGSGCIFSSQRFLIRGERSGLKNTWLAKMARDENQEIHFMGPYVLCPLYRFIADVNQLNWDSRYTKLTHFSNKLTGCSSAFFNLLITNQKSRITIITSYVGHGDQYKLSITAKSSKTSNNFIISEQGTKKAITCSLNEVHAEKTPPRLSILKLAY